MNAAPLSVGGCVTGCSLLQLGAPQGMPLACDPRLGAIGMLDLCELDIAGPKAIGRANGSAVWAQFKGHPLNITP